MASLFSARRKPKRIAREDASLAAHDDDDSGPVVRRPGAVKNKSKLRVSFNPGDDDVEDSSNLQSENDIPVVKPQSKLATAAALQDRLKQASLRETDQPERPSYNKSYLDELRNSTPSTPQNISTTPDEDEQRILDIESKFGPSETSLPSTANATNIPSATEIAEKKARRARLALSADAEQLQSISQNDDFVSLEAYDSDGEFKPQRLQVGTYLHQPEKTKDTRLEREDEDIAEGFEQFIEDDPGAVRGRYSTSALQLDRKSRKAHAEKQKREMRALIDHAENTSSSDDEASGSDISDSDNERRHAYETSQTHRGLDGLPSHTTHKNVERRPRQPRETTPIVKLSVGLGRLREQVELIQQEKARIERRLGEVRREKGEVRERGRVVQQGLEGLGREMEALRTDAGTSHVNGAAAAGVGRGERGLESFGVPVRDERGEGDEMEDR